MNSKEQITKIKETLANIHANTFLPKDAFDLLNMQLNTLEVIIETEIVLAKSEMIDDSFSTKYEDVVELSDSDKHGFYHEEEKKRLSNELNQK
jgi:hypothetical protein